MLSKGDLSKFIEEAVRWRIFNLTVQALGAEISASLLD
jgi:Ribbon-helix-helix domain